MLLLQIRSFLSVSLELIQSILGQKSRRKERETWKRSFEWPWIMRAATQGANICFLLFCRNYLNWWTYLEFPCSNFGAQLQVNLNLIIFCYFFTFSVAFGAKSVAPWGYPQVLLPSLGFTPVSLSCGLPDVHQYRCFHFAPGITSNFHGFLVFCEGILKRVVSKQEMKECKNYIISQGWRSCCIGSLTTENLYI